MRLHLCFHVYLLIRPEGHNHICRLSRHSPQGIRSIDDLAPLQIVTTAAWGWIIWILSRPGTCMPPPNPPCRQIVASRAPSRKVAIGWLKKKSEDRISLKCCHLSLGVTGRRPGSRKSAPGRPGIGRPPGYFTHTHMTYISSRAGGISPHARDGTKASTGIFLWGNLPNEGQKPSITIIWANRDGE